MRRPIALLLLAAAMLSGCGTPVVNPVTGRTERSVMSEADEVAEGRKAHEQVLQEFGRYDDARLQAYVEELGQRLAAQSHRAGLRWTFTVLDSPEVNAFALPGGYVYVTRGIMAFMASEADLAGVLGHEIAHVTARHGAQRAGLGVLAVTVLGAVLESAGVSGATNAAGQLSQTAAAGYIASYSREQESQADALGAEYLARNRYDPRNMIDVIRLLRDKERFAAESAGAVRAAAPANDWLASHPSNEQRLTDIQRIPLRYAGNYGEDGRLRYLQAIEGMGFGESREQRLTRGQDFFHEGLGIAMSAPAGWTLRNGAEAITLVNRGADAALVVRVLPGESGRPHDEVLRALKLEQGSGQRTQINGLAATRFGGVAHNEQGRAQPVRGTLITGPGGHTFLLLPLAKDANALERAAAALRQADGSLRPLSAEDRRAARPWALRIVPYPRGGFVQLARESPLGERAEARLRLLNGHFEGGERRPGERLKVVVAL